MDESSVFASAETLLSERSPKVHCVGTATGVVDRLHAERPAVGRGSSPCASSTAARTRVPLLDRRVPASYSADLLVDGLALVRRAVQLVDAVDLVLACTARLSLAPPSRARRAGRPRAPARSAEDERSRDESRLRTRPTSRRHSAGLHDLVMRRSACCDSARSSSLARTDALPVLWALMSRIPGLSRRVPSPSPARGCAFFFLQGRRPPYRLHRRGRAASTTLPSSWLVRRRRAAVTAVAFPSSRSFRGVQPSMPRLRARGSLTYELMSAQGVIGLSENGRSAAVHTSDRSARRHQIPQILAVLEGNVDAARWSRLAKRTGASADGVLGRARRPSAPSRRQSSANGSRVVEIVREVLRLRSSRPPPRRTPPPAPSRSPRPPGADDCAAVALGRLERRR